MISDRRRRRAAMDILREVHERGGHLTLDLLTGQVQANVDLPQRLKLEVSERRDDLAAILREYGFGEAQALIHAESLLRRTAV